MATDTLTRSQAAANGTPTAGDLDNATCDLYVADTFLAAAKDFADEVREWSAPKMPRADEHVFRVILQAQTMIEEARDKINAAKAVVDAYTTAAFAAGKGGE